MLVGSPGQKQPAVVHSRTEEYQQNEAKQLEQALTGTSVCIPAPL